MIRVFRSADCYGSVGTALHNQRFVCETDAEIPVSGNLGDQCYSAQSGYWRTWGGSAWVSQLAAAWPVGSIFFSTVSTNPATLLGFGTWSAIAAGRVLVGLDAGQQEFDVLGEIGGAKTVTLTTANLPAHNHAITDPGHTHVQTVNSGTTGGTSGYTPDTSTQNAAVSGYSTQSATTGISTQNTGSGTGVSVLQPYLVVCIWTRTA